MKENKLTELSMDFSVDIINLVKQLKSNHESIISNQNGRRGTSNAFYKMYIFTRNANRILQNC